MGIVRLSSEMAKVKCAKKNEEFQLHTDISDLPSCVIATMENKPLFSTKMTKINHFPTAVYSFLFQGFQHLFSAPLLTLGDTLGKRAFNM